MNRTRIQASTLREELRVLSATASSTGPRWLDLCNALDSIAKNPEASYASVGSAYARSITGLDNAGLRLFIAGLRDNADWMHRARRGVGFGEACADAKVRGVFKKMFVLEPVNDLTFVTDASVIEAAAEDIGGMRWDRTNTVTRVRRNKVMNWGTQGTRYQVLKEHEFKEPVILVPEVGTEKKVVFHVSPKLVREAESFLSRRTRSGVGMSVYVPFWSDLAGLCHEIVNNADERECFTYGPRVKCDVSLIDVASLRGVRNETGRAHV